MIPDAEIISLVTTILTKLDVGEFTVKVWRPIKCVVLFSRRIRLTTGKFSTVSSKSVVSPPINSVQYLPLLISLIRYETYAEHMLILITEAHSILVAMA